MSERHTDAPPWYGSRTWLARGSHRGLATVMTLTRETHADGGRIVLRLPDGQVAAWAEVATGRMHLEHPEHAEAAIRRLKLALAGRATD